MERHYDTSKAREKRPGDEVEEFCSGFSYIFISERHNVITINPLFTVLSTLDHSQLRSNQLITNLKVLSLKSFVIASPVFISRTSIFGFLYRGYPYHWQCGYRDTLNKEMTVGRIIISSSNLGSFAPSSPSEPASHVQYSAFVSEFVQVVKV